MFLKNISRPVALGLVFVASFIIAMLLFPIFIWLAITPFESWPSTANATLSLTEDYWRFLVSLAYWQFDVTGKIWLVAIAAVWATLTVAFLAPITGRVQLLQHGRSLRSSVAVAVLMGSVICGLIMGALIEGVLALMTSTEEEFYALQRLSAIAVISAVIGAWIVGGALWAFFLRRSASSRNPAGLDLLLRRILAGTAVELVLGLPIALLIRRRSECYCSTATFFNFAFGTAALLWICGPWSVLFLTRKARANWSRTACASCGYPRRSGGSECSECGQAFAAIDTAD
ncbi:MAG: hypothetical protein DWI17_00935 [Planctomycetota bacterium]|nr:MAG: hypothetical protein DWI17_00935 [Planctomycetota bacterium]